MRVMRGNSEGHEGCMRVVRVVRVARVMWARDEKVERCLNHKCQVRIAPDNLQ